jgi:hypothetical protein
MKLIVKDKDFVVYDDVFEQEIHQKIWAWFNGLDYAYRMLGGWQKVWKITDGHILSSNASYHTNAPFNCELDWLHQLILILAKNHVQDIVGDWDEICLTPYLYPANTKISWHDDCGYTGACIYYPHHTWNANWGGELMIARTGETKQIINTNGFTREDHSAILNEFGMGVYINPKPNRLVFTRAGVWHSINRVDQAAGDAIRTSVVGFFQKKDNTQISS